MDFGIDRLIDMFEERFGKLAATALLAVIGLGAAGWAIHSVVINLIEPAGKALVYARKAFHDSGAQGLVHNPFIDLWSYLWGVFAVFVGSFVLDQTFGRLRYGSAGPLFHLFRNSIRSRIGRLEDENKELQTQNGELWKWVEHVESNSIRYDPEDISREDQATLERLKLKANKITGSEAKSR